MGVDAVTVGNHEFDFGLENFHQLQGRAAFPFLSANIVEKKSGRPLSRSFLTIPLKDDLAVTVIGVTTEELLTTTLADNVATLGVTGSVSSVRQVHDRVRSQGPVVLLSHSQHRIDREIAAALPDLAAIIGGHDHVLLSPYGKWAPFRYFRPLKKGATWAVSICGSTPFPKRPFWWITPIFRLPPRSRRTRRSPPSWPLIRSSWAVGSRR